MAFIDDGISATPSPPANNIKTTGQYLIGVIQALPERMMAVSMTLILLVQSKNSGVVLLKYYLVMLVVMLLAVFSTWASGGNQRIAGCNAAVRFGRRVFM
ncbi:TPA: hypothetical protein SLG40_004187 [Serratia odorifera]|nr:hypothetical protein [Serratia odorifera]